MKRAALLALFTLTACEPVKLPPRPYACDHNGGDGGQQCLAQWSCGFDDRCFPKNLVEDGGIRIAEWECENETHCPNEWQCGVEVDGKRLCQQLGVGAPSPCAIDGGVDAGGCQGGWRCGNDEICFNPAIPDGGATRECSGDEQCPLRFVCGELVEGRGQHCIEEGVNAPSNCNTDEGCEGTNRCDTFAHRCVQVTDVITTGRTSNVGAVELSPRRHEPPPIFFAMTRLARLQNIDTLAATSREGVLMASVLQDGGLRVAAQFRDEFRPTPGMPVKLLHERSFPLPGGVLDVTDLAVSSDSVAMRFRDGGASRILLGDGRLEDLGQTDLLRQIDPFEPQQPTGLLRTFNQNVHLVGSPMVVGLGNGQVQEVVAAPEGVLIFATMGSKFIPDGGPERTVDQPPPGGSVMLAGRSKGAIAGYVGPPGPQGQLSIYAQQPLPGGGTGVVNITNGPTPQFWQATPVYAACPDGGVARQLAIDVDEAMNQRLYSQCVGAQGATFPVSATFKGGPIEYRAVVQDQLPYQNGLVTQYASPFVRAHAGANGRVWHAVDTTNRSLLGSLPLRPVQLDRQPETMLSFFDQTGTIRVYAQANGVIYTADPQGGLVSQLAQAPLSPLSIITSRNWIVGSNGLLDVQSQLRLIATLPAGETFSAPATGVTVQFPSSVGPRDVVLVASGDSLWLADVTDALAGEFAQPAVFSRVLVPVPGVPLRSMALSPSDAGVISGYLTTSTNNLRFSTDDLVRWFSSPVAAPAQNALPLEVWGELDGGAGRTGFTDGRVWSLPIMVPLTQPLVRSDGSTQLVSDYGRKCGDVFAVSSEGLYRAQAVSDGGLPAWAPVTLPVALESTDSLKLFETKDSSGDRLFIGTRTGQVLELTGSCP